MSAAVLAFSLLLAARGESLAAFDGRCIPTGCVAPRSNTPGILGRRALPVGRLARLGATPDFHHGLPGIQDIFAQAPAPISWSLTVPPQASVRRGQAFTARLVADIQPGWHLYSINQPEGGPIATQISLPPGQPFAFAKAITESKTNTIFDQAFGIQVRLHTTKADFGLPLTTPARTAPGTAALNVEIRYQSCTDTLCLPPRTVKVGVAVQVRDR